MTLPTAPVNSTTVGGVIASSGITLTGHDWGTGGTAITIGNCSTLTEAAIQVVKSGQYNDAISVAAMATTGSVVGMAIYR